MAQSTTRGNEATPLLGDRLNSSESIRSITDAPTSPSIISISKAELAGHGHVGERLPYNDYTTIDWLRDLTKDLGRSRELQTKPGIRGVALRLFDKCQGWLAASIIGALTALVAFAVDVSVATVSDWKAGYCTTNLFLDRSRCCVADATESCGNWRPWATSFAASYALYVAIAAIFGAIAGNVTMTTKASLPAVGGGSDDVVTGTTTGKTMYMAAGSGIPEIKTILSGFVIPHFLDFKVMVVKAVGATFAVSTGMCLGKEGPFVHISTCVGYLVANLFPKYRDNPRKMREMLSVACSAGLSVAFGAPIGGVLFSYEEISTYFPRRVLWRAFLCSLVAAVALKALNPTGTGKLVLFETNYGVDYEPVHYVAFVFLGVCGGLFGGIFCQANFFWSKHFRKYIIVKEHPVFELCLVVLVTALLQFPNLLIRDTGDIVLSKLLVDCRVPEGSWICEQEAQADQSAYRLWLAEGTLIKLLLTIITFGCKVPSGIIIPALDSGALFGRLIGQVIPGISPGIFAMVGAAAFLAGVSRMTVSLAVIMFELTGEVTYTPPFMCAILTAKWVADAISLESVYDLSQHLLGHPFLDSDHVHGLLRNQQSTVEELIPPSQTMEEITLFTGSQYRVSRDTMEGKLRQLKARGLMDAGLVLVNETGLCHGYLPEAELEYALELHRDAGEMSLRDGILAELVDHSPLILNSDAPIEYAVEMFGKLGLRYLIVVETETSRVLGVVIKKRLLDYVERLKSRS